MQAQHKQTRPTETPQSLLIHMFNDWVLLVAWMPDELSPAHNILGREVRSGIALLGRNYA